MGLPDLSVAYHAIAEALVGAAAQAAEPGAVPPVQAPVQLPSAQIPGIENIVFQLGGWGGLLLWVVQLIRKTLDTSTTAITGRLDSMNRSMRRLRRALVQDARRRGIETHVKEVDSDDDYPGVQTKEGT